MDNKSSWKHILCFILGLLFVVPSQQVFGQDRLLNLEIELSPILENAQVLSLTGLGIDEKGSGPVLLSGILENLTGEPLENLYFEVTISSGKRGRLIELTQKVTRPFSLQPYQTIYATNNDLANEQIPGIEEKIIFDGGLTSEGDKFINTLGGSLSLPKDTYSFQVKVFRITQTSGREDLASAFAEVGEDRFTFDGSEIYLKTPGDVVGSDAEITSLYPQFSWDGKSNGALYRLLVVKGNGQDSPESLLESAKSSAPVTEGGSLLQFEQLDVMVRGTNFQYPTSGVQPLETDQTYYWQVITSLKLSGSSEEVTSEIWSFNLAGNQNAIGVIDINDELQEILADFVGHSEINELLRNGYVFEGLEMEGQQYVGTAAVQQLEILFQKLQDDQLIIVNK